MINIQNINNYECFNWCLVGYLHPEDDNSARADKARVKVVKNLAKELGFKFPVKLEKKNLPLLLFLVVKTRKNTQYMYQKEL